MNTSNTEPHPHSSLPLKKPGFRKGLQRVTINPNIPITDIQIYCNPNVRVGNWSEDWITKQAHFQEFLQKQKNGQLVSHILDTRVQLACEEAPLSKHLGYQVPLLFQHIYTLGLLSCDVSGASIPFSSHTPFPVSISEQPLKPMYRNVIEFIPYQSWDGAPLTLQETNNSLYFGDQFYIVLTHLLPQGSPKLYLQSIPKSTLVYSAIGKQGEVSFTPNCSSACRWKLIPDNPYYELEREGTLVLPGHRVCIQHCLSGHCLFVHPNVLYRNDFGFEYEVMTKPLSHGTLTNDNSFFPFVLWVDQPDYMMTVEDLQAWQEKKGYGALETTPKSIKEEENGKRQDAK